MNWKNSSVVVTGGSGFLGSRVVNVLKEKGVKNIIVPRSANCDLRLKENCSKITKLNKLNISYFYCYKYILMKY